MGGKPYDFLMAVRAFPKFLARALPKSESSKTLIESAANKRGLSKTLDGTLKEGAHDMRVFGLGFLRSLATKDDYVHFTTGMFHYYGAMEERFGKADRFSLPGMVWQKFPELPRQEKIKKDLQMVGAWEERLAMSAATEKYVESIHCAADEENGARLLGHLYVRYFADLFGGRALGTPTRLALKLPETPHFYTWDPKVEANRRAYIERIYVALNEAGDYMSSDQRERVVDEARGAFAHNAAVYVEQPGLTLGAARGAANIVIGVISVSGR